MEKSLILLQELGFNPKEIEVYLLLLESGTTQASTLARRLKLPTSTAQYACQQLTKKGLLRMVQKGNRYLFSAEPPSKLSVIVEKEIENLQRKQSSLDSVIAELESKINPESVMPKVRFFEGRDGVAEAYGELLRDMNEGDELLSYLHNLEDDEDQWNMDPVFKKFRDHRIAKKVTRRTISPFSVMAASHRKDDAKFLRSTRFVKPDFFGPIATEVILCGTKIYSMSYEKNTLFAYIVQNKPIADMHKDAFELAWKEAEREDAKLMKKAGL